ncbi:MAG: 16S rRNA (cytosine(1402)-N(4))-methyltransferase RsmH [Eubacterium sp.]|nr:16S rRNA (cytosine(1402)-N(4))-methyltransferase RsmH [Eubacterium sp.]MBR3275780.1 16S rRNA (cytosine(1402)-N(4))-methyltransferase RsmH [Eubacterium sp.]
MEFSHVSVLLTQTIKELCIRPDGLYADGTLGGGGHSEKICESLSDKGRLYGFDVDEEALKASEIRLAPFSDRTVFIRKNFREMVSELSERGVPHLDGIVLDLGVSSHQLDDAKRGFTYRTDTPLDMRMDNRKSLTAEKVVNTYSEDELYRVIKDYGEERFAGRIAQSIVRKRAEKPILTTGELADLVKAAIPARMRGEKGHPAKRTFQAIRIEVNDELAVLEQSLDEMIDFLADRGRLCIITFHSLEDRIVKNNFRKNENPCICPPDFPVCTCGRKSKGKIITRKPVLPDEEELLNNPRSHSAKLRVFERRLEDAPA